jgi:hypothetical protein
MKNYFTPLGILGLIVLMAGAFVAVHFLVSWSFMYCFALPALYFVEAIQARLFPALVSWPLGGYLAIVISVISGVGLYVLLLGATILIVLKIYLRLAGNTP